MTITLSLGTGWAPDGKLPGRRRAQIEYELQFSVYPKPVTCRFHRPCHEVWESVCLRGE
ncbi:MAG TPA: hypothetical protein VJ011_00670 [Steroidobacteraceae bacterium]|nr:hypothetical protein [Steroidobacteraceae bacterium]